MSLWHMSLAGACVILLTVAARTLGIHRLPKRTFLALWALACLRLLVPIAIPVRLSTAAPEAVPLEAAEATEAEALVEEQTLFAGEAKNAPAEQTSWREWLPWLWLTGSAACAAYFLIAYGRGKRCFREACPMEDGRADRWLRNHKLRRNVRALQTDRISMPMTCGLVRPAILFPKGFDADDATLDMILRHEWTHIRRMDVLRKGVLIVAACVHWFNPMVWVMLLLANRDIELVCDEQVLREIGGDARRAYASALIEMESGRRRIIPLWNCFAYNAIEERIIAIMKTDKKKLLSVSVAAALVLSATAAFATATFEAPNSTYVVQESGEPRIDEENWQENFAEYEPYGLTLNKADGRLYYNGHKVRYFEDMYPVDEENLAGTVVQMPDGEVDVHSVRDLSDPIIRNEDGSFDPSGVLIGLEAYSQEEFDARTESIQRGTDEISAQSAVEWWTADEYAQWLEKEKEELQALVGTGAMGYTKSDGWFVWTQERVDETIALYESDLEFIRDGGKLSKLGEDGGVLMSGGQVETTVVQTIEDEVSITENKASAAQESLDVEQADDGSINPEIFAAYAPFGLTVQDDALYYEGQRVRNFSDVYKADLFRTVSCQNYDPEGSIDVEAVREQGRLSGLKIVE